MEAMNDKRLLLLEKTLLELASSVQGAISVVQACMTEKNPKKRETKKMERVAFYLNGIENIHQKKKH